jgi:hypothetical protein
MAFCGRRQGNKVNEGVWEGPHDGEVPTIERCDLNHVQAFGQRDHCRVRRSQRQVRVDLHQLRRPPVVPRLKIDRLERRT